MTNKNDDFKLLEKVKQGNNQAFDALVLKYQYRVTKMVSKYISDPVEVMDIAQESFIRAYKSIDSFQYRSSFFTWLCRIVINTAKNHLLSKGKYNVANNFDSEDLENLLSDRVKDISTPEYLLIAEEIENSLKNALDKLPYDLKTAITLREIEGFSYDDIANVMNCPVGTIRSRIFRAREALSHQVSYKDSGLGA